MRRSEPAVSPAKPVQTTPDDRAPALPAALGSRQIPSAQPAMSPADVQRGVDREIRTPDVVSPAGPVPDVITPPVRIRAVPPAYPDVARAAQLQGDVLLQALVGLDGRVSDIAVVRSVHPLLDEAARKAVLRYEYTPGRRNGVPEPAKIRITVSFRMR
jgi:TonB family protein